MHEYNLVESLDKNITSLEDFFEKFPKEIVLETEKYYVIRVKVYTEYWYIVVGKKDYEKRKEYILLAQALSKEVEIGQINDWYMLIPRRWKLPPYPIIFVHKKLPFVYLQWKLDGPGILGGGHFRVFYDKKLNIYGTVYKCVGKEVEKVGDLKLDHCIDVLNIPISILEPREYVFTFAINFETEVIGKGEGKLTEHKWCCRWNTFWKAYEVYESFVAKVDYGTSLITRVKMYYEPEKVNPKEPCEITWQKWPIYPKTPTPKPTITPTVTPTITPTPPIKYLTVKKGKIEIKTKT